MLGLDKNSLGEIIRMVQVLQAKHALQCLDTCRVLATGGVVDVLCYETQIGAAVLGHTASYGVVVLRHSLISLQATVIRGLTA